MSQKDTKRVACRCVCSGYLNDNFCRLLVMLRMLFSIFDAISLCEVKHMQNSGRTQGEFGPRKSHFECTFSTKMKYCYQRSVGMCTALSGPNENDVAVANMIP